MERTDQPLPPEVWAATRSAAQALIVALQARIRELEAQLGQNSSNSSCPPSTDQPQTPARVKAPPTGRKRGGQPGHRGAYRALLPVEQVYEVVVVLPQVYRHRRQAFPVTPRRGRARVRRHQVVELVPLVVQVTAYQMGVRRCQECGKCTRADLPAGVPRRPFGPRLTAVAALLSGRYRLSRREVRQAPWTFARVDGVEPTNNRVERALRPAVLWRKGSFGSDSAAGGRFAERLLMVVATCRQRGRPLLDFLGATGEAASRRSQAPPLLPVHCGS